MNRFVLRVRDWYAFLTLRLKHLLDYRHTDTGLIISSTVLGITVGIAIVVFHAAVSLSEQFFNRFFVVADVFSILRFLFFPLIAGIGGFAVGVLNSSVFKDVDDRGLETVTRALKHEGVLHHRTSLKAILNAALSIGSGGGAGREAPTIVLGASVGSSLGQMLRLRPRQLKVLCGAGTAAAISGIFNAPLGGVMFALETILGGFNISTFIPLVISAVMATATSRLFFGDNAILVAPAVTAVQLQDYFFLAIAGMASGGIALYYLRSYRWWFERVQRLVHPAPVQVRPAIGGLFQGLLVAFLPTMLETTYQPINFAIRGEGLLAIAIVSVLIKPISVAFTLGSGGSGGTFAPAMKMGALFGFAFGYLLQLLIPSTSPGLYALVCTAAVLAGTYRMPLAGGILVFEISRNYELILPLMFASVFSAFVIQRSRIGTFNPTISHDEVS
ncbi:MAG TPA: chloride channel protein [Bacteroidota bacterium]|nr:chloride channel protein [Bacteroidota bacterium]